MHHAPLSAGAYTTATATSPFSISQNLRAPWGFRTSSDFSHFLSYVTAPETISSNPALLSAAASLFPTLNLDSRGRPLKFTTALNGPNREEWMTKDFVELVKLVLGTGTLKPTMRPSTNPTYYNRVVKEKAKADGIERRVRGTAGGDRVKVPYNVSSATASMTAFKCLLNATVSDDDNLAAADASDFYLGADLPAPVSIKIYTDTFSAADLATVGFTAFIQTDPSGKHFVYCDIVKSMYGLPMAGLVSHLRLVAQLYSYGYIQTTTPCVFRHLHRNLTFCLVVDDFAIKYKQVQDLQHLTECLAELYHIKVHPICTQFLGFTVDYDRTARTISLSYPNYIPNLLARLRPDGISHCKSPSIYIAPQYGSTAPQVAPVDTSPPATAAEAEELGIVVGSLLYYARAVDATMLQAVCSLASLQAHPTKATMQASNRLLGYAAAFPANILTFKPSDMILRIHSDASYLSRPKSGSTAGGFHYLGTTDPAFLNGPIFCHSTRIPVVCAAVSEAEYGALFSNAQVAVDERSILTNLGYPQPPTILLCDNECAVGLATETVRPKRSKSIDMRFNWTRCRVRQHQFKVEYIPGPQNLADFFTKPLPVHTHQSLAHVYSHAPPPAAALFTSTIAPLLLSDTGASHILLRRSCLPYLRHLFSPKILPSLTFTLPNGASLTAAGSDGGLLRFPHKPDPVECYVCDDFSLAHNLVGASPLLRPDGHAIYTPTTVEFYSPHSPIPFLSGSKSPDDALWSLRIPQ